MKKPYLNQIERFAIISNNSLWGAGLLFHLKIKVLEREIGKTWIGKLLN